MPSGFLFIHSNRESSLFECGMPRNILVWNDQEHPDRYVVQFTKANNFGFKGRAVYITMSDNPYHPDGLCLRCDVESHKFNKNNGKRISFTELPTDCQRVVLSDYCEHWFGKNSDMFRRVHNVWFRGQKGESQ